MPSIRHTFLLLRGKWCLFFLVTYATTPFVSVNIQNTPSRLIPPPPTQGLLITGFIFQTITCHVRRTIGERWWMEEKVKLMYQLANDRQQQKMEKRGREGGNPSRWFKQTMTLIWTAWNSQVSEVSWHSTSFPSFFLPFSALFFLFFITFFKVEKLLMCLKSLVSWRFSVPFFLHSFFCSFLYFLITFFKAEKIVTCMILWRSCFPSSFTFSFALFCIFFLSFFIFFIFFIFF